MLNVPEGKQETRVEMSRCVLLINEYQNLQWNLTVLKNKNKGTRKNTKLGR